MRYEDLTDYAKMVVSMQKNTFIARRLNRYHVFISNGALNDKG